MITSLAAYQPQIIELLNEQIRDHTVSQVLLFGGERYTLRMSTALEVARVLGCMERGDEDCSCPRCTQFATLTYSDLVIISQRDHNVRIEAALHAFVKEPNGKWRSRLIQTIRILLVSFHPVLMEEAGPTLVNLAARAGGANDLLYSLISEDYLDGKQAIKYAEDLRKALKELYSALPKSTTVTINQVRSIDRWVHQTNISNQLRFVILEGIEQTNVAARNALLKLLEEPPQGVYFILISEHPSRIMQTILSRVRRYSFVPLSPEAQQRMIAEYGEYGYSDLASFYLIQSGIDLEANKAIVEQLITSLSTKKPLDSRSIAEITETIDKNRSFEYVLAALCEEIARQRFPALYIQKAIDLINHAHSTTLLYNQNQRFATEALYYRLLEER